MVLFLTGCGGMPVMTADQEEAIGEYAAVLLLKYDANNRSRLVDLSLEAPAAPPEAPATTPEPAVQGMRPPEDTPAVDHSTPAENSTASSMEEFFGLPAGITVTYQGAYTSLSYPEEEKTSAGDLLVEAADGKSLLVLEFIIANQTGTEAEVNLFQQNSSYRVTVNNETSRYALTTMLMNDMSTYMDHLQTGESVNVVLLVEMDQEDLDSISNISLKLKNEAKTYTIQLQ